jgi:hypothetical protein
MAQPDIRKINRLVTYRSSAGRIRAAKITAVGAGTNVDLKIVSNPTEVYLAVPRWSRSAPGTAGWYRSPN